MNFQKAPFPWFGGKSQAAKAVWQALGDVNHYVEPFAGSLAVLLNRPHEANRPYFSETVNDLDGLLVNAWRAIQLDPEGTAFHASNPVSEIDLMARHIALVKWRESEEIMKLRGTPDYFNAKMAGWWLWGISCWIGSGWCSGNGPWTANDEGNAYKQGKSNRVAGVKGQRPHLGDDGQGVNQPGLREPGVSSKLPHLGDDGQGVNQPGLREPGVSSKLPHLGDDGQGVNQPGLREPGVSSKLPHLANNGQGVNRPVLREPGVSSKLPHLGDDGQGVNNAGLREPGVSSQLPHLGDDGQGVNQPGLREPGTEFHPVTMPRLIEWFRWLSARLRHVRICSGDWRRVLTPGASITLSCRTGGSCGIFLDPPYSAEAGRADGLYASEDMNVAHDVRRWCLENGNRSKTRIVLAGYDNEHTELESHGWRVVEWYKSGFLKGGMGNTGKKGSQQKRERLWLSPQCLGVDRPTDSKDVDEDDDQVSLFGE